MFGLQPDATQMCVMGSQVAPVGHTLQSLEPSQPSPMIPQYWPPAKVQEDFVQLGFPQISGTLAPQSVPAGQLVLQLVEPPHPSPMVPQYVTPAPAQLVLATQAGAMQICFWASQVVPAAQPPQSRACPHPSPTDPQYLPPANVQLVGVQLGLPQRFATPEPPQVSGAVQSSPQSTLRPQPSPMVPQ